MEDNLKLSNPQVTIAALKKYNFTFRKRFGQNFLIDGHVIRKIINAADISRDDTVIEIGPGIGTLTQYLAESSGAVKAVEIDRALIPILADTLSSYDNVEVINEDILKTDIESLSGGKKVKVVANLPYYITTPIIMQLLETKVSAESITVMIQKEVADRMAAKPGGKDYGALSLAVQYYAEADLIANVPPNCFMPRPGVGSAVIKLSVYDEPPVRVNDEKHMFRLIKAAFGQRRKTMQNAVSNFPELDYTKEDIADSLEDIGLDPLIRGEKLSLLEFAELSDRLQKRSGRIG